MRSVVAVVGCRWRLVAVIVIAGSVSAEEPAAIDWPNHPVNSWVKQSPRENAPVPGFQYEGSGDYDPVGKRWIHHGGHDGIPQGFHTFSFDPASGRWEQWFPPTSPPGVCCVDGSNAFDCGAGRFVRFPGGSLGHGFQWSRGVKLKESSAWLLDPTTKTWTNMRPPPYKTPDKYSPLNIGGLNAGAVYVPNHEVTLSFGGQGAGGGKNTLFAYDAHANMLHQLPGDNPPSPRDGMGMAYDALHDHLILFGGQYTTDERTWLYDLKSGKWEGLELDPHPPGLKSNQEYSTIPRMAYHPPTGQVLCVIWNGANGHETWVFEFVMKRWRKITPAQEVGPSKSRSRNLAYLPDRNAFLLETSGHESSKPEIWTYRLPQKDKLALPPPTPTDVRLVAQAGGKATITWNPTKWTSAYEVHRAAGDLPWKLRFERIAETDKPSFEDSGLEPGVRYTYYVVARDNNGKCSLSSLRVRTTPAVPTPPIVSVVAKDRVEITWDKSPAEDVVGYNLYRGVAHVRTVTKGTPKAWSDNDPAYEEPQVVQIMNIDSMVPLFEAPLPTTSFTDRIDVSKRNTGSEEYRNGVYAYIVRSVNRHGMESGPSPYALTIPSEPRNVLCREEGETAHLQWSPAMEKDIAGYHVYKLEDTWSIVRVTPTPIRETTLDHHAGRGLTRFWIVTVDALGQEGQPSSPAWFGKSYRGFFSGEWHP